MNKISNPFARTQLFLWTCRNTQKKHAKERYANVIYRKRKKEKRHASFCTTKQLSLIKIYRAFLFVKKGSTYTRVYYVK